MGECEPTRDEGVCGRLQRAQAISDDEDGRAEAPERLGFDAGNGNQGADGIEREAPDEDSFVRVVSQNPGGVSERSKRVGAAARLVMVMKGADGNIYPK